MWLQGGSCSSIRSTMIFVLMCLMHVDFVAAGVWQI